MCERIRMGVGEGRRRREFWDLVRSRFLFIVVLE